MQLDMDQSHNVIRELASLGLLQRVPHRCTAHKPGAEEKLDSSICFCPVMRDTVEETLLPEERHHMNAIAARVYSNTHPMDHPLQFLVRSRHHRLAGDSISCIQDIQLGLRLIPHSTPGILGIAAKPTSSCVFLLSRVGTKEVAVLRRALLCELAPQCFSPDRRLVILKVRTIARASTPKHSSATLWPRKECECGSTCTSIPPPPPLRKHGIVQVWSGHWTAVFRIFRDRCLLWSRMQDWAFMTCL